MGWPGSLDPASRKYMVKRSGPPSQGWRTFLCNHAPDIAAMDFFVAPLPHPRSGSGLRRCRHPPVARHAMGIRDKPIASGSPWENGFAERLIGSIRRECVDHVVVLGEGHLRRILAKYATYYDELRTHRSLNKDAPIHRAATPEAASYRSPSSADFITIIAEFLGIRPNSGHEPIRYLYRKLESERPFKGIICDDISEFESYMPSQVVPSLRGNSGSRELAAARLRPVGAASILCRRRDRRHLPNLGQ
jgi:hypothetical protein